MSVERAMGRGGRPHAIENPPPVDGRVPPHDLRAEAAVVSAILLDAGGDRDAHRLGALDVVGDLLRPEHFYSEAHRRIYEAALDLHARSQPVDVVQVATWLKEHDRLEQIGGVDYIARVLSAAPVVLSDHVRAYAQTVVDTWLARQTILLHQRGAAEGYVSYAEQYGDARGYVLASAEQINALALQAVSKRTGAHVRDVLTKAVNDLLQLAKSGRELAGLTTGIDRYDRATTGLRRGDLTVVAARPGMGKTSLAMGWAEHAAMGVLGRRIAAEGVAVFSLEMPKEQLAMRMAAASARIDVQALRSGFLSPAAWGKLMEAATHIAKLPIWIDDSTELTVQDVRAKLRWAQMEAARTMPKQENGEPARLGLAIIDFLQLMKGRGGEDNRNQEIGAISRGLKALAKDLDLAVVALAQLNRGPEVRGGEKGKGKRPQLSDLRDSGEIEQDADNVCFIYRDDYYNKDSDEPNVAELIIAKQRNGPIATVKARFDKHYTRFDNLGEGELDDNPDQRTGAG